MKTTKPFLNYMGTPTIEPTEWTDDSGRWTPKALAFDVTDGCAAAKCPYTGKWFKFKPCEEIKNEEA